MKRLFASTALIFSLFVAGEAMSSEEPLLLVVSDFDAALRKGMDSQQLENQQLGEKASQTAARLSQGQQQLERILVLLREKRRQARSEIKPKRVHVPTRVSVAQL